MGSIFLSVATFLLSCSIFSGFSFSAPVNQEFIYPNFTASNFLFIDSSGVFLASRNESFQAIISQSGQSKNNFYFYVLHVPSNTIIWTANRDAPISESGKLSLTVNGLTIVGDNGTQIWSTPALGSPVTALQLLETGNLVLLDKSNRSLWQSFDYPTDTIVIGQRFPVGKSLSSATSQDDLSTADYRFSLTSVDGLLQWHGLIYWRLSMEPKAYKDVNSPVAYMAMNATGLYLFDGNGEVVVQVSLSQADFRIAKLDYGGHFIVQSFLNGMWSPELEGPDNDCKIPFFCKRLGLCRQTSGSRSSTCSCPPGFRVDTQTNQGCIPSDSHLSLPSACNSTGNGNSSQLNSSTVSYMSLGASIDYFANSFLDPSAYSINLTACRDLCTENCSCSGLFYDSSSSYCYLLNDQLGSFMSNTGGQNDRLGYIKALAVSLPDDNSLDNQRKQIPLVALVLLPFTGFTLLVMLLVLSFLWWRRRGLPVRFDYEEIEAATNNFSEQIGAGGFGAVYKGALPNKTLVAVKKITNLGVQGKKEFCTEIATIGNIHHVNLVRLKGFCVQGRQKLLVYEYMNRGSLDRILFGNGPVLEWQERVDIAVGVARGLAYLHSGCDNKIIHCDVKPENILLHSQFQVKISDFGLSKLLTPEQSSHFTTMRGTRGYLAPEWLTSSAITDKTDVYSYGMVLLEIVRGRKNCLLRTGSSSLENGSSSGGQPSSSSSGIGAVYFPLFALEMHEQGRYLELADPRLEGRVTSEEVEKLVRVALCCVQEEPTLRPSMVNVVSMLEGGMPLGEPRVESLNFLRFYGRRFVESSTIQGQNTGAEYMLDPQSNASETGTATASNPFFSYMSSQQVSGPR
uniref:Receptor-like serine/threonine-protein kinase n=1 Tax=Nelumbo nucifera TaxID=4432 RepID=A0A822Z864_NELNU|nr:TPA_asm: hypothetical protein HUJ06_013892 [Nelumbo nucifera]